MSYVQKRTWLENGPARKICTQALQIPIPRIVRAGMGAWLDQQYCDSAWSLLDPTAWFGCLPRDAANVYEQVQYGHIPRAGELPTLPAPNAPQTQSQMLGIEPFQAGMTADQQSAWVLAQRAALDQAVASGSWNPEGNLPVTVDDASKFFKDYGTALMIAGVALGGLVLWQTARR